MANAPRPLAVVWTPSAEWMANLAVDYQCEASPEEGEHLLRELHAAADGLATGAAGGRVVPELGHKDVREVSVGSYRLQYRLRRDQVEILAVCRQRDPR